MPLTTIAILAALILRAATAHAGFCAHWNEASHEGTLPFPALREASGMALSQKYLDRVYWINDSGDKGHFYSTNKDGTNRQKFKIKHFSPADTEALAAHTCREGPCLVVGDIGDNKKRRKTIELALIAEPADDSPQTIIRRLSLAYPDGPRDAEAMAILPSGDLIIVTKELRLSTLSVGNAGVYTLSKEYLDGATHSTNTKTYTLRKLGELPLPNWLKEDGLPGQVATDMAVNNKRQVVGILTYSRVVEIPIKKLEDLSKVQSWKVNEDFALVPMKPLSQQESMTYALEADQLLWSTEYMPPTSPIFSMTCDRTLP